MKNVLQGLKNVANGQKVNPVILSLRNKRRIQRLKNQKFSLIANNCVAGTIYKDLRIEYQTPIVGLYILPSDFVKLCEKIEVYMSLPLVEIQDDQFDFPIAMLGDVKIFFMHYRDFETASESWYRRLKRFKFENIFLILVQKDGCSYEDMARFDRLSNSRKIILTSKILPELSSAVTLRSFEGQLEIGDILNYKTRYSGHRYVDEFDFVNWLNSF